MSKRVSDPHTKSEKINTVTCDRRGSSPFRYTLSELQSSHDAFRSHRRRQQLARDELAYLLKGVDDINVVAQGKNGLEAVNLILEHNPDLVFLDVQMPGLDGFGVIKKLLDRKVPLPKIVFATAFDQYAVKAFEVNAVDYLLKPFDKKRVAQSVQKARSKIDSAGASTERLETLVRMLEQRNRKAQRFSLRPREGFSWSTKKTSVSPRSKTE
jgi:DNA-binding LytR/AlgR family response regulator